MKLYYSSGACSMSCHIALEVASEKTGAKYTALQVDFDKPDANLAELERLNPLNAVPVLVHEGKTLTQNLAILEYVADSHPDSHLLPKPGTWERAEAMQWLSFVSSDLHKSMGMMFGLKAMTSTEQSQEELRKWAVDRINGYCGYLDKHLAGKDFILGKQFSVVDGYAFTILGWSKWSNVSLAQFKNITGFMNRVAERPAVQKVLKTEDMLD